MAASKPGYINK